MSGELGPDAAPVIPPSLEVHVAVNARIGLPWLLLAVKATVRAPLPFVTPVRVGAAGAAAGTVGNEAREFGLVPISLVAVTVQV